MAHKILQEQWIETYHDEKLEGKQKRRLQAKLVARIEGWIEGKLEGYHTGLKIGRQQCKLEVARQMFAKNCDWDFITDVTGVTQEQLEEC